MGERRPGSSRVTDFIRSLSPSLVSSNPGISGLSRADCGHYACQETAKASHVGSAPRPECSMDLAYQQLTWQGREMVSPVVGRTSGSMSGRSRTLAPTWPWRLSTRCFDSNDPHAEKRVSDRHGAIVCFRIGKGMAGAAVSSPRSCARSAAAGPLPLYR